jgi:hypothetical protein
MLEVKDQKNPFNQFLLVRELPRDRIKIARLTR